METKQKTKINFHMHSTGSDGKLSPEELVQRSIEAGLDYICFTDHYIRPADISPWTKGFFSKKYLRQIKSVQKKYKRKIDISFGMEVDWIEGFEKWTKKEISKFNPDYVLGSIHLLFTKKGEIFGVNFDEPNFAKKLKEFGGSKKLIQEYFRQLNMMIDSGLFDCIAHLDVIKTFNEKSKYFSTKDKDYKKLVLETLDNIKKHNMCIEINTSGWTYKCKESFPSLWILKQARKRNIPITIGTDCHFLRQIDYGIDKAYGLAKKAGYNNIVRFKKRKPIKISI